MIKLEKSEISEMEAGLVAYTLKNAECAKKIAHNWILHSKDYYKELRTLDLCPAYCIVERATGCAVFHSGDMADDACSEMIKAYAIIQEHNNNVKDYDIEQDDSVFITDGVYCEKTDNLFINTMAGYIYNYDNINKHYILQDDENIYDILTHKLTFKD